MGFGIKRRLRQGLIAILKRNKQLLRDLTNTPELKRELTTNVGALREIVHGKEARPLIEEKSFVNPLIIKSLEKEIIGRKAYEKMIISLTDQIEGDEPTDLNWVILTNLFITALDDENFCAHLFRKDLTQPPSSEENELGEAVCRKLFKMPAFQEAAFQDENFHVVMMRHERLQKEVLLSVVKDALWKAPLREAVLMGILRDHRLYEALFGDSAHLGRIVQEAIKSDSVRRKLSQQPEMRGEILAVLASGPIYENAYEALFTKILADQRTRDRILNDNRLLENLLIDDRAVVKTATLPPTRIKLQLLRSREIAAGLPYLLPSVVLSYPRAGSNFLQSVLQGSSGLRCQSIYSPFREGVDATLTVKSHSPSPLYFEDEWRRLLPERPLPGKIIRLQRDPRDVLISFLEYTEANRKTEIRQEEFLNDVDYFYASTVDRDYLRAHYKKGMSVAEAFKEHVRTWYIESPPEHYDILPVRYEDLVLEPQETFNKIFAFLNLDCELAEKFLKVKVSLYSDTGRARARIQGWRENTERYGTLLKRVEEQMAEEIRLLGYGDAQS